MRRRARIAAYVYPGWHPTDERDASFHPGFTEWELVRDATPRFDGHEQPRVPLWGEYDDRDPLAVERRIAAALDHGVDAFVYGFFWCRGKQVFEAALERGFLGSALGARTPYAVMWANRMPRRVLPVRRSDAPVIDPARLVPTDVDDFVRLVLYVGERHFARNNYLRRRGAAYFSIFDSTFFARELGHDDARLAIRLAREALAQRRLPPLHLAAIDPAPELRPQLRELGFDSVTHYVVLPHWRGPYRQDYAELASARATEWPEYARQTGLLYDPSVATGWDASPRGADFGSARPDKYPWSPVVVGDHPDHFQAAMQRAFTHAASYSDDPWVFVASLNEWSEGHYLEPDTRFGLGMLEALRRAAERAEAQALVEREEPTSDERVAWGASRA